MFNLGISFTKESVSDCIFVAWIKKHHDQKQTEEERVNLTCRLQPITQRIQESNMEAWTEVENTKEHYSLAGFP